MLVKLLMHCYPTVKLIVMSATLQATLFANYFAPISPGCRAPDVLAVGARVFPVEQIFLDDLKTMFDFSDGKELRALDNALQVFHGMAKGKGKGKGKKGGDDGGFLRVEPQISEGLIDVTAVLVQQLAQPGCTVIVFLPGIADITSLFEVLAPYDNSRESSKGTGVSARPGCPRLRVYALHSMIPRTEQEEVFHTPAKDSCHIVLASNIAESSLTLPSVCAVVDLALRRTVQYDTRRLMCCLVTTWCSQSSCKQRKGRAGRTMAGRAVCLVPRKFFEDTMPAFDPPEMLNAPLTKLYLQAKQLCATLEGSQDLVHLPPHVRMDVSHPKGLLNEVVQPPSMELLEAAMEELAAVGCLTAPTEDAEVTPLGRVAVALPCDLRICRLIYLGCLFQCPNDAIAMAAGLTASDPFSAPSLLVLKDQKEYVQKLNRSFAARRWCDHGTFSEPIMLHTLFVEWIRAGAPRGAKGLGAFVREWSVMPKKFESLACDAVDLTVRIMKLLKPRTSCRNQIEELLGAMHHGVDRHQDLVRVPGGADLGRLFRSDVDKLRAILTLAFSDQMLLHLQPRWVPSPGSKKKKQEEQIYELMKKHQVEPVNTVAIFVPNGQDEDSMKVLCTAMAGEAPETVHHDAPSKVALVTFPSTADKEGLSHEKVLLWDVPAAIHRLHMFGSGRYRFFVEIPNSEEPPVELFKPLHPFLIQWEVLSHPGRDGMKKPSTVRGMCDWRNPLGFACHVDDTMPPAELLGCCASIQGLESGSQAFVAGATVLPLTFLPVLLGSLCPVRWQISWAIDVGSGEIRGVKILHHELVTLPAQTLAPKVIKAVNVLRSALRNALAPASWFEEPREEEQPPPHHHKKGRREREEADLLDPPDLTPELMRLLEVLPAGGTLQRPKKIKWRTAVSNSEDETWDEDWGLSPFQLLADQEEASTSSGGKGAPSAAPSAASIAEFQGLLQHLAQMGECDIGALPKKLKKSKKVLERRPDLFAIRMVKGQCYVRLAAAYAEQSGKGGKGAAAGSSQGASRNKGSANADAELVKEITKFLNKRSGIVGLGELGSQEHIKALLAHQKGQLQKIRAFLGAHSSLFQECHDESGQLSVWLVGSGGKGAKKSTTSKKGSGSQAASSGGGKAAGKAAGKGSGGKKGAAAGGVSDAITDRMEIICRETAAVHLDFDHRVKQFLKEVQERQGTNGLDDAFEFLHEWLMKKAGRDDVKNWPGYIMALLNKWRSGE